MSLIFQEQSGDFVCVKPQSFYTKNQHRLQRRCKFGVELIPISLSSHPQPTQNHQIYTRANCFAKTQANLRQRHLQKNQSPNINDYIISSHCVEEQNLY